MSACVLCSARNAVFGNESVDKVIVSLERDFPGDPTGVVKVKYQSQLLCKLNMANLNSNGQLICTLGDMAFQPGTYTLTAKYSGDGSFAAATTSAKLVVVSG